MKKFMLAIGALSSAAIPAAVALSCANKNPVTITPGAVVVPQGTHSNIKTPQTPAQHFIETHPTTIPTSIVPFFKLLEGDNYVLES